MSEQDIKVLLGREMNIAEKHIYNLFKDNTNYRFIVVEGSLRAENIN